MPFSCGGGIKGEALQVLACKDTAYVLCDAYASSLLRQYAVPERFIEPSDLVVSCLIPKPL